MLQTTRMMTCVFITAAIAISGCGPNPEASRIAMEATQRQAEQNQEMARLNQEMARNNERLIQAEADARNDLTKVQHSLIERDAECRSELAALQRETESFVAERHQQIALSRDELESERQAIANQRHRDPIVAAAIQDFGLILACLAPIGLAVYLLYAAGREEPSEAELAEVLLREVSSGGGVLMGMPYPRISHNTNPRKLPPSEAKELTDQDTDVAKA